MRKIVLLLGLLAAGCAHNTHAPLPEAIRQDPVVQRFTTVAEQVTPVAQDECDRVRPAIRCDFVILIDTTEDAPPNAFQGVGRTGQPQIVFTRSILHSFDNEDEMAFVLAHEAAHHIRRHLAKQADNAVRGAVLLGELASLEGATAEEIENAQYVGAFVGGRIYSKAFELEADALGAIIAHQAGFRPSVGARYFTRIPDPGDQFLGTHPASPDRIKVVDETIEAYGLH